MPNTLPSKLWMAMSIPKRCLMRSAKGLPREMPTSMAATLLPLRTIGVTPKTLMLSRPGSTPAIGVPLSLAVVTVLRRGDMSSPNALGACKRRNPIAGGNAMVVSGMPCSLSASCAGPSRRRMASRSSLAIASSMGESLAITVDTASAVRPS